MAVTSRELLETGWEKSAKTVSLPQISRRRFDAVDTALGHLIKPMVRPPRGPALMRDRRLRGSVHPNAGRYPLPYSVASDRASATNLKILDRDRTRRHGIDLVAMSVNISSVQAPTSVLPHYFAAASCTRTTAAIVAGMRRMAASPARA